MYTGPEITVLLRPIVRSTEYQNQLRPSLTTQVLPTVSSGYTIPRDVIDFQNRSAIILEIQPELNYSNCNILHNSWTTALGH
jgi:hypothetical protein